MISRVVNAITLGVTTPLVASSFGLEIMGMWLLVSQIMRYISLSDLGLQNGLLRYLPAAYAKEDTVLASRLFSTALLATTITSVFIIILTTLLIHTLPSLFKVDDNLHKLFIATALVSAIGTALILPLSLGNAMLASIHKFDRLAYWDILTSVARLIIITPKY